MQMGVLTTTQRTPPNQHSCCNHTGSKALDTTTPTHTCGRWRLISSPSKSALKEEQLA
jgi:hypothetical protein